MSNTYFVIRTSTPESLEDELNAAAPLYDVINTHFEETFCNEDGSYSSYVAVLKKKDPSDVQCPNCKTVFTAQNMSP